MLKKHNLFVPFSSVGRATVNESRRSFLKHSGMATTTMLLTPYQALATGTASNSEVNRFNRLTTNSIGFNGQRKDPVTGFYHLGNGYRVYNPGLMRFHAADSMSPFGKGGVNSYAYALGDPVHLRDPSGHFAILSLIIGAIIGAVVGAAISATVEGIRSAITGDKFDWKQVAIGAGLGLIGGGFGAAAVGAKTGVQVGLAVADAVVSSASDFGLNVAAGVSLDEAGKNAGIGAVIGLVTFGLGKGVGRVSKRFNRINTSVNSAQAFASGTKKNISLPRRINNIRTQGLNGGGVEAGKSFASDFYNTVKKSLFFGKETNLTPASPARTLIESNLADTHQGSSFASSLYSVNKNLASHADNQLDIAKAASYLEDANKTITGELSNSSAHLKASLRWAQTGGGTGAAGTLFNLSGFLMSGVIDRQKMFKP